MTTLLQILGGLGMFLYGMRVMSTGLQKLAGARLRSLLARLTRSRVSGVIGGFFITAAIQSSSATTVLVVSFANAGLLTLLQAVGLVMGANIGTTVTGWLIALLGFKVKISAFALPIIGIAFPLSFHKNPTVRQLSETLIGFGFLFLGLQFLKDGVPDLKSSPETLEFLRMLTGFGFGSMILFVLVGSLLTVIVQSSSATMAITLTMAHAGWLDYHLAAAMVLGENIGTTITANLAAIGASRNAVRVARFHSLFNIIGVLWVLPLMGIILPIIADIIPGDVTADPTRQLAMFHTIFNVANTLLLAGFANHLVRLVMKFVPDDPTEGDRAHLEFLETRLLSTPELAVFEVRRALQIMVGVCGDAVVNIRKILLNPTTSLGKVVNEIKHAEDVTDTMEEEIVAFCAQLARTGSSADLGERIAVYLDAVDDLERIGDHCYNIAKLAERRFDKGYQVPTEVIDELTQMLTLVTEFIELLDKQLSAGAPSYLAEAKVLETKLNKTRHNARKAHAKRMQAGEEPVKAGLLWLDMFTNLEKIGDYTWNVLKAFHERPVG